MAFSQDKADAICALLAQGASLRKACREVPDAPSPSTVLEWCQENAAFGEHYTRARAFGYALRADGLMDTAEDMEIPADQKRIMIDAQKWELSKMLPKVYGDKLDLNHTGQVSVILRADDADA